MSRRSLLAAAALVIASSLSPSLFAEEGRADGHTDEGIAADADGLAAAVLAIDTVIPTVRIQLRSDEPVRALLAWSFAPIVLPLVGVGPRVERSFEGMCGTDRAVRAYLRPFVEPQLRLANVEHRVLVGGTVPVTSTRHLAGVHLEGGAVLGPPGPTWFGGGGITIGPSRVIPWGFHFAVSLRWVALPDGRAITAGLDSGVPFFGRSWRRLMTGAPVRPVAPACRDTHRSAGAPDPGTHE